MKPFDLALKSFAQNSGATPELIAACERQLKVTLAPDYRDFMMSANGGEGFIGPNSYLMLWRIDELHDLNVSYEVDTYLPGCLLFGSNGGGEGYGFDLRNEEMRVIQVPFVGMQWSTAIVISESFRGFIDELFEAA